MLKIARRLVVPALLSVSLTAPAVHAQQQQPVTVGVIYPVKTMLGQQAKRGAEVAVDMLNASGGVLPGRQLRTVVYDDNFNPAEGVAAARRLASEDKVKLLVGGITSAVTMAVMQVVLQNDMVYVAPYAKAPQVTENPKAFRINPLVATEGEMFNKLLRDDLKAQRVAVVVENGDYGRTLIGDTKSALGDKVVATELFEILKQTDFSTLASRVKAANPDAVCLAFSNPEQGGALLRSLKEAGVPGKRCIFPGSLTPAFVAVAGPAAEGAVSQDKWEPSLDNDMNRKFVAAFKSKYGDAPNSLEYLSFEGMYVLGQAIRRAGTATDTGKVAAALREGNFDVPRGKVTFPGNQATAGSFVALVVKDGKVTRLK